MSTTVERRRLRWPACLSVALGASLTALPFATPAAPPGAVPQATVKLSDLDLSRPKDVAIAYGRLRWAATQVCPFADSSSYWLRQTAKPCLKAALQRAVEHIGSPQLTAYYLERTQPGAEQVQAPSTIRIR